MEHYIEDGTADSVAALRSSSRRPPGYILVSNVEKYVQILIQLPVRLWRQTATVGTCY